MKTRRRLISRTWTLLMTNLRNISLYWTGLSCGSCLRISSLRLFSSASAPHPHAPWITGSGTVSHTSSRQTRPVKEHSLQASIWGTRDHLTASATCMSQRQLAIINTEWHYVLRCTRDVRGAKHLANSITRLSLGPLKTDAEKALDKLENLLNNSGHPPPPEHPYPMAPSTMVLRRTTEDPSNRHTSDTTMPPSSRLGYSINRNMSGQHFKHNNPENYVSLYMSVHVTFFGDVYKQNSPGMKCVCLSKVGQLYLSHISIFLNAAMFHSENVSQTNVRQKQKLHNNIPVNRDVWHQTHK